MMIPDIRHIRVAILVGALLAPALAEAQAPPSLEKDPVPPTEETSGPNDCVRTRATTGEGIDIRTPGEQTLSQLLADAQGVICPPPRVDPAMKKPAPGGGITPVIPPPASDEEHKGIEPK